MMKRNYACFILRATGIFDFMKYYIIMLVSNLLLFSCTSTNLPSLERDNTEIGVTSLPTVQPTVAPIKVEIVEEISGLVVAMAFRDNGRFDGLDFVTLTTQCTQRPLLFPFKLLLPFLS